MKNAKNLLIVLSALLIIPAVARENPDYNSFNTNQQLNNILNNNIELKTNIDSTADNLGRLDARRKEVSDSVKQSQEKINEDAKNYKKDNKFKIDREELNRDMKLEYTTQQLNSMF